MSDDAAHGSAHATAHAPGAADIIPEGSAQDCVLVAIAWATLLGLLAFMVLVFQGPAGA